MMPRRHVTCGGQPSALNRAQTIAVKLYPAGPPLDRPTGRSYPNQTFGDGSAKGEASGEKLSD